MREETKREEVEEVDRGGLRGGWEEGTGTEAKGKKGKERKGKGKGRGRMRKREVRKGK